ncbi:hypothetical protein ACFQU2_04195 [Siccirubricoccus deserti]
MRSQFKPLSDLEKRFLGDEADEREALVLTKRERAELDGLRKILREELRWRLCAGQLIARGFIAERPEPVTLPPQWWRGAQLDVLANTATAPGLTVSVVFVYPAEADQVRAERSTEASEPEPDAASRTTRRKGGRPPTHNWRPFQGK